MVLLGDGTGSAVLAKHVQALPTSLLTVVSWAGPNIYETCAWQKWLHCVEFHGVEFRGVEFHGVVFHT